MFNFPHILWKWTLRFTVVFFFFPTSSKNAFKWTIFHSSFDSIWLMHNLMAHRSVTFFSSVPVSFVPIYLNVSRVIFMEKMQKWREEEKKQNPGKTCAENKIRAEWHVAQDLIEMMRWDGIKCYLIHFERNSFRNLDFVLYRRSIR